MPSLSPTAREFARVRLRSLLQLDVVLLLQADTEVWWSAARVASALRVGADAAGRALEELAAGNLLDVRIATDLTYRFAPWHENAAQMMSEIAANHYEAKAIVARSSTASAAERFADAFRIRKSDG
jgi:hypothetical protein